MNKAVGHAPRERVSWNSPEAIGAIAAQVTLHVSVWVEIQHTIILLKATSVTLHVSVWVEIFVELIADLPD